MAGPAHVPLQSMYNYSSDHIQADTCRSMDKTFYKEKSPGRYIRQERTAIDILLNLPVIQGSIAMVLIQFED
jgi:hypothetical protein